MKLLAEPLGSGRRTALVVGALAFAMLAVLAIATKARASETIYWDNYNASPVTIGLANIDGSGGSVLNNGAAVLSDPEGIAYDPVNGRLYIANSAEDNIAWVAIDGSGGGILDTTGTTPEDPEGIAVDAKTQTVYWANDETLGSIGYASANGGGGGTMNIGTATHEEPYKIALDTVNGRVYWDNHEGIVSYANLDGSGGADLPVPEGQRPLDETAINVDPAAGRLYFLGESPASKNGVYWLSTSGVGGGEVPITGATYKDPYGMAFDPTIGRFYWANYGNSEERAGAIGTTTLAGTGGGISILTAPFHSPQDPVVVKSPSGTAAPAVAQSAASLTCSQGGWSPDYPGSYVYAAPLSYSYQWLANGAAIPGATASTYTATAAGSYSCVVTGANRSGSASQTSAAVTVTAATLSGTLQGKRVKVKAGKTATVKLKFTNAGEIASAPLKVCAAKLGKKAKKGLKPPKCASLGALAGGGSGVATLKVKTLKTAKGTYKFSTSVSGVKSVTISVNVTPASKGQKKKHKKH